MKKIVQNLDSIMLSQKVDSKSKDTIRYIVLNPNGAYATRALSKVGVTVQSRRRKRRIARLMIEQAPKDIELMLLEFQEEL